MGTSIEFYRRGAKGHMAVVDNATAVPREGELISIRGQTWKVSRVAWAVDNADKVFDAKLRCNVDLEPAP